MKKNNFRKIKIFIILIIFCLLIWFLVISPFIKFRDNENKLLNAAKRYFEINTDKLPVGERVKTLSLNTLYKEAYLEDDFKIPYTGKVCSLEKSWVKVTRVNGEYKYYVYLDCGILKSNIDHEGPNIKLKGSSEMTINVGDKFVDPGVESINDSNDGNIKNEEISIKGEVNINKVGTYEIEYFAFDKLNNKGSVIRKVNVVNELGKAIKKELGEEKYYKGLNPNNYIYFSNMLFRILSIDDNKVRIVAERDISNVNYDGIEEWFKYFDSNLTNSAKKLIIKNKYCNMKLDSNSINSMECNSYGNKKKYGLLSITDINNTFDENSNNYLIKDTISWTSNIIDKNNSYACRYIFSDTDLVYRSFENKHNFGVRPVITIDGNNLLVDGDGKLDNPFKLKDYIDVTKGSNLNKRYVGEHIRYSDKQWIIQGVEEDGSTKLICESTLDNDELKMINYDDSIKKTQYNPKEKGNVGYIINNVSSKYIESNLLVSHEITVPIYKNEASYKKEEKTKKYNVKISSPNMYDMFSAASDFSKSYWLLNSSNSSNECPGVSDTGVVMYDVESKFYSYGVRPVIYLNKRVVIVNGSGTTLDPFIIK